MSLSNQARKSGSSRMVGFAIVVRALTPSVMVIMGAVIGVMAIVEGGDAAAFGLAGTAIAGAAGLSQSHSPVSERDRVPPSSPDKESFSSDS